jgi:citronellyl-CoA dehydrogenase
MLASMAKLKSGRPSREMPAILRRHGLHERNQSVAYRDTRLGSIGGGSDAIMLAIICKHMGILPGRRNR